MDKNSVIINSGASTFIADSIGQYSNKGSVNFEQSIKSGIMGCIGGAFSVEMSLQDNQSTFSRLLTNPKNILLTEEFVKQNKNLNPKEKKDISNFLKGFRFGLQNLKAPEKII